MSDDYKEYLGDSVYAAFDGYHLILTTENGNGPSNRIALEPEVMRALTQYQQWLRNVLDVKVPKETP